jgi:hypothetical protein
MRVCNDARLRACFAAYNSAKDVETALGAVERIARDGIPDGTPTAAEWTAYMADGED